MIILNGKRDLFNNFPNGEVKLNDILIYLKGENIVELFYEDDKDLIRLKFIKDFIDDFMGESSSSLYIYYMPYSRMDRTDSESMVRAFTLKSVCNFINDLKFKSIVVFEPHSDVTLALLNNAFGTNITYKLFTENRAGSGKGKYELSVGSIIGFNPNSDYVCFPDAGAQKRYHTLFADYKQLIGFKDRDFKTGKINDVQIVGKIIDDDFNVVIVDDLSSKGFTFLMTAKSLKRMGAKKVYLIVAHCENSIYDGELLNTDFIDGIFTTNSILTNFTSKKIQVYNLLNNSWEKHDD